MKILKLRFKNLNSLVGEWSIDFTSPEYVSHGIFAITGPTGAGKSTILDAICLSLYGRTPRLKVISKSVNEIMSRQTGECFAEVTFQARDGVYRCHWSQHRARKNAEGRLADSKHELSNAETGKILETKKREVARAVEEKTGMDYDRFTRSILLAQGGFAAFLQASPDGRSPILEQITGTEIYSEISIRVHERRRREQEIHERLQAETSGIVLLGDDELEILNQSLSRLEKREAELRQAQDNTGVGINWLRGMELLRKELGDLENESGQIKIEEKSFEPERQRLDRAIKAADLDSEYASLESVRKQQALEMDALAGAQVELPGLNEKCENKKEELDGAARLVQSTRGENKRELEVIKRVRALDLQILEKKSSLNSSEIETEKIRSQIEETGVKREGSIARRNIIINNIKKLDGYFKENARDGDLVGELTGIGEQMKNLQEVFSGLSDLSFRVSEAKKLGEEQENMYSTRKARCRSLRQKYMEIKEKVRGSRDAVSKILNGRLLREVRAEHASLLREMAFLRKIADLTEERKRLEDEKPCPLCGSLHHPYARGNVPEMDETEKKIKYLFGQIQKVESLENELEAHEKSSKEAELAAIHAENELELMLHKKSEAREKHLALEKEQKSASVRYEKLKENMFLRLRAFGVEDLPGTSMKIVYEDLGKRAKKWQDSQIRMAEMEKEVSEINVEISGLTSVMETLDVSLKKLAVVKTAFSDEIERLTKERLGIYGGKDTDIEEKSLENKIVIAERTEREAREVFDRLSKDLHGLKIRIDALKESTAKRKEELKTAECSFLENSRRAGFENEAVFRRCRLHPDERNSLFLKAKGLQERAADIETRRCDRAGRLAEEAGKNITDNSLEELEKEQTETREALRVAGEEMGAAKQKLAENQEAQEKHRQKRVLIEAQEKECSRWDALHSLIGSSDGKKYRNFAQGITFELMVSHANRQLQKMTDRYLLERDSDQPLELNVVDNYQAGEIRSTKNLSGGESFIVSLSLALGLSHMSSRNVRVDSLFLDEGFGTLDEDALDTALETLSGLQQDGKLIGIISHVPALKERIGSQILVNPESGGKSSISGPGCSRK